jgi:exopolyphosphatase/guanosine-5'-triphosphate,3'-diphosphate pyrophosphatase
MKIPETVQRWASIDLGTNTILLLIADIRTDGSFHVVADRAQITRLGQGVDRSGLLSEAAQNRSLVALKDYARQCQNLAVDEVVVVGTSALRDAANREAFIHRLEQECGWKLRVLSGEEEARYSFAAVCCGLDLQGQEALAVDVGGGSTELIRGKDGALTAWVTLQLGSVRLTERYLVSDPPVDEECRRVAAFIDRELAYQCAGWRAPDTPQTMVGIAGTFTTLAAIAQGLKTYSHSDVHGSRLTRAGVQRLIALFESQSAIQRRQIPGLDPGRADVILAGSLLVERIMAFFNVDQALISDQGVRYGILYEKLERDHAGPGSVAG